MWPLVCVWPAGFGPRQGPGSDRKYLTTHRLFSSESWGATTRTRRLKSGAVDLRELATRSAHRDFRPTNRLSETRLFCDLCAFLRLFLILALDQRLIDQVGETLEEAMLVVREMLGKDEQDELFNRINAA
jgi:hypothetical protein